MFSLLNPNRSKEKKTLISNFFSLSFLEAANYVLPLLTLPYLLRVLGPEKFGLLAFAESFAQYFGIFTDYGFNLSAVREISINRKDRQKVNRVYCSVVMLKALFLLVSLAVLSVIVLTVPRFRADWYVYFFSFGVVIGQCLFPVWFFQGMEKMRYITVLNISAKVFFTVCIFFFVRKSQDFMLVPLIQSAGFLSMGVAGLWIAFKDFNAGLALPDRGEMRRQLAEGWHLFLSRISMSLYTTSSTFILGLFANNTIVGYYSAGERVIRAAMRLLSPVSDAVYPYISKLAHESVPQALAFIRKLVLLIGGGTLVMSSLIFLLAPFIGRLIFGNSYDQSINVLRILALVPFFAAMSTLLGTQTMLAFNMKKEFSRILVVAGVVNVAVTFALAGHYKHIGVALSVLFTEVLVVGMMYGYLKSKKLIAL